ncbi:MAG: 3D domain-containing protein [Desulfobacterales bacterium]
MVPFRIIFPWLWFSRDGTIAADTRYYTFGTRLYVPGYGYGVVEDRGSAIKGPTRLDLFISAPHSSPGMGTPAYVNVTFYNLR